MFLGCLWVFFEVVDSSRYEFDILQEVKMVSFIFMRDLGALRT